MIFAVQYFCHNKIKSIGPTDIRSIDACLHIIHLSPANWIQRCICANAYLFKRLSFLCVPLLICSVSLFFVSFFSPFPSFSCSLRFLPFLLVSVSISISVTVKSMYVWIHTLMCICTHVCDPCIYVVLLESRRWFSVYRLFP